MKKILSALLIGSMLTASAYAQETGPDARGAYGHHHRHHARMEQALSQLPEDKATLVRERMKQEREASQPLREQSRQLRKEMKALAEAENFDKAAFLQKAEQARKLRNEMAAKRDAAMADVAEKLTAAERKSLIDAFGRKHGKHDGMGKHEPEVKS